MYTQQEFDRIPHALRNNFEECAYNMQSETLCVCLEDQITLIG